ncbi:flexible cuticle protein 12-like [Manduca sexta]|uniref:flexible cuticle protein 12-like n=1 Tax=Manduca sexta TaxID=7130 RepID=UPI0018908CFA|nr:flexible cuticle protein 12-like [Manduca sexta]
MNKIVIFITLAFSSSILSAPSRVDLRGLRTLPAIKHEHLQDEFGQYALRYVTAEGTIVSEKGQLIASPDGTGHVMIMEGEVIYIGEDGKTYVTKYTAGLDGVKVEGDHLPVAPTVPPVDSSAPVEITTASADEPAPAAGVTLPDAPTVPSIASTVAA